MLRLLASLAGTTHLQDQVTAAANMAAQAEATGQNARQMVLNRDPKLNTLEAQQEQLSALATSMQAAIPAAELVHTELRDLITALTTRVATLEAGAVIVRRVTATTPGLTLLASTVDIPITWPQPLPDETYSVFPHVDVTGLTIGKVTAALKQGSKTKTGCTITYSATGIQVSAGQNLDVLAVR
jgi:hypothetical protein